MESNQTRVSDKTLRAQGMLLAASLIWGFGFIAGKLALTSLQPFAVLAWRFEISALLCLVFFSRRILKTPRRTMLSGILIGCIQVLTLGFQLTGLKYTTAAKQSFLCTAYVALTPFMSRLIFKNRLRIQDVTAGCLCLCGVGLICLGNDLSLNRGDALSLCYAVSFAVQVVLTGRFVAKNTDSIQITFFQFLTVGTISLIISLIAGYDIFAFEKRSLIGIGYLAVMNTFAAYMLQNAGQKHVKDTTAALIISLYCVFGFIFSELYFGNTITWRLLAGGTLCFSAVLINVLRKSN